MGERRIGRTTQRTDQQILAHGTDMELLRRVARSEVSNSPELRWDLRRLANDDLIMAGFGRNTVPMILPRGQRILSAAWGETVVSPD